MSALGNREEIKDLSHRTSDESWSGPNVIADKATVFPDQIRAVLNQAEQEKQAADQRIKEALELMSVGSRSVAQPRYQRSSYEPRFKILDRDLCP